MKEESHKRKRIFYTAIKILVLLLGVIWFYHNWNKDYLLGIINPEVLIQQLNWVYLIPALLFFFLNWFIEIKKWQLLMRRTEVVSFKRGSMAVFAGTTASALIPYKMGSYLGRMLFLKTPYKARAIPATILGNILQSSITFFVGIIATFYLLDLKDSTQNWYIGFAIIFFILLASLPFYYKKLAVYLNEKFTSLLKTKNYRLLSLYENNTIWKAWFYSLIRYILFSLHFALILKSFGLGIPFMEVLLCVSTIYFLQSFTPSFIVLDFGVKASIAISVISIYTDQIGLLNYILVFHYILNSILPVCIGGLSILLLKIKNK